jgi:hypothetical protein
MDITELKNNTFTLGEVGTLLNESTDSMIMKFLGLLHNVCRKFVRKGILKFFFLWFDSPGRLRSPV